MGLFTRERKLRRVQPGDEGYARVAASLHAPAGPARDAAQRTAAAGMVSTADKPAQFFVYDGDNGEPCAIAQIRDLSQDRPGVVEVWVAVDPVLRRFGLGEKVYALALDQARKLHAQTISSYALDVEGIAFLSGHDFTPTQSMGVFVAPLAELADAAPTPPAGYDIRTYTDCPAELLDARARLQEDFVRATPHGTTPIDEAWHAERVRAWFVDMQAQGGVIWEAVALHDGAPVAFSNVIAYPGAPRISQRDTYVAPEHRGHGLARALKAATARAAVAERPDAREIRSFVDLTNEPMLAVNRGLGFRQTGVLVEAERPA